MADTTSGDSTHGPLADVRVLDLATSRAELAGRLLADLGAEVIKVEPPVGVDSRRRPPFDESAGPRRGESLYWAALGLGKRSVVLDLTSAHGREALIALAADADVLVESFPPGTLDALGLGYATLSAANPALVYISVTPYGQDGPKAGWPATDLTIEAAGGRLSLQGDRDRPPLPIGYPQAAFHAGAQAAADVVIALNERAQSGLGQRLDTSMQAAMIWTLMDGTGYPPLTGADPPGSGDDRARWAEAQRLGPGAAVPCADGYVIATLRADRLGPALQRLLAENADGGEASLLRAAHWATWSEDAAAGRIDGDVMREASTLLSRFVRGSTKRELMDWAVTNDIMLAAVQTTHDILDDPQFVARDYWRDVGGYRHPGPPARVSRTPLALGAAAPALGADQALVPAPRAPRVSQPPPAPQDGERTGQAFAGLRVADFTWVAAGPMTAKALADHGATVVKIESGTRLDLVRSLPPFKDNIPGANRSHWLSNVNSSKLSLSLNLRTEGGRALARRMIDWADVVLEAFTPGTMARLGLDYEAVSAGHDDLIWMSTCLLGQTGPRATFAGYGSHGAALSGFIGITGWPDRAPVGPAGPYTDVITPRFGVPVLTAAILERRRSGRGQYIDLAQVEGALRMLEPLLLDESVNGRTAGPAGHDSPTAAPHGVYAAAGVERYVAIAVESVEQWRALRALAPLDAFVAERFDALVARRDARDEIDAALAAWSATLPAEVLEERLVAAGVPASRVQRMSDLYADPQLAHRGFFVTFDHPEMGHHPYDGLATRFSAKPEQLHTRAPLLGEHTEYVLRDLLGLESHEITAAAADGSIM